MSITTKWNKYNKIDVEKKVLYDVKAENTILCNVIFCEKDKFCKDDNYFLQGHNAYIKEKYITEIKLNKD
jgi:hypothetical protein